MLKAMFKVLLNSSALVGSFIVSDPTFARDVTTSLAAQKSTLPLAEGGSTSNNSLAPLEMKMQRAFPSHEMAQVTSTKFQADEASSKVVKDIHALQSNYSLRAADLQSATSALAPSVNQGSLQTIRKTSIAQTSSLNLEQPESSPPDKRQYNLFRPTPRKYLRDFSTDRPNLATSPLTIDPGIFQIEADIVNYSRKGTNEDGNTDEKFLFASTTVRTGLTHNTEFRLLFQPYNLVRTTFRDTGEVQESSGLDTLQAGLKINLIGNDTYTKPGASAFGILPFLNIPTARNGVSSTSIEGGLAFLSSFKFSDTLDLEVQLELDVNKNSDRAGYHVESFNVVSLDYQITPTLGTFFEIASRFGNESRFGASATLDTGLLINVGNDTQLDIGIFKGLTRAADDINPFFGISKRF